MDILEVNKLLDDVDVADSVVFLLMTFAVNGAGVSGSLVVAVIELLSVVVGMMMVVVVSRDEPMEVTSKRVLGADCRVVYICVSGTL